MNNNRPLRLRYALGVLSFFALLALAGLLSIALPKPAFSGLEGRSLEKRPAFSLRALALEHYPDGVSRWYSDTFPAREWFVGLSSALRGARGVGGRDGASIHFGVGSLQDFEDPEEPPADGPAGEPDPAAPIEDPTARPAATEEATAPPVPDIEGEVKSGVLIVGDTAMEMYGYYAPALRRYAAVVNRFAKTYRIPTSVLVTPTNVEFKLPARYKSMSADQKKALEFLGELLDESINNVWVYDTMARHSGEYVYFRTDHHWTGLGAHYAYLEFCKSRGFDAAPIESYETWEHTPYLGSLYRAVGGDAKLKANPDTLTVYGVRLPYEMYCYRNGPDKAAQRDYLSKKPEAMKNYNEKYGAFTSGDPPYTKIIVENNTGRKLLLIRESYAAAMTPFLVENYDEIHVVDFRYYRSDIGKLIREAGITEALFLNYISAAGSSTQMGRMERMFGWGS